MSAKSYNRYMENKQYKKLEKSIDNLVASTAKGFEHNEKRLGKIDARFGKVEKRFDGVEGRLINLEIGQSNMSEDIKEIKQRQILTDGKIDKIYQIVDGQVNFQKKWEVEQAANVHAFARIDVEIVKIKKKIKIA